MKKIIIIASALFLTIGAASAFNNDKCCADGKCTKACAEMCKSGKCTEGKNCKKCCKKADAACCKGEGAKCCAKS